MTVPPNLSDERPSLDVLLDRALATGGETDGFDFKELLAFQNNGEHKIKLLKAIGAFGNTDNGGNIIIGVTNDRRVVGITPELAATYDQTPVQRMVGEYFAPPPTIQVRQHERDGKKLVIIEVLPFRDVPSIVKKHAQQGEERLRDGTFLVRNAAAESALLTTEVEMRKLCDAISTRRARSIVELIQRGSVGLTLSAPQASTAPQAPAPPKFESLAAIHERAETFWSSADGAAPYLETHFAPEHSLSLRGATLPGVFPSSAIPVQNGFPFHTMSGLQVQAPQPWGWLGVIPFREAPNAEHPPSHMWLLELSGAFLYRRHLENDGGKPRVDSVGMLLVLGRVVQTIRFLDRFTRRLGVPDTTLFRVGVVFNHVMGRCLVYDAPGFPDDEYVPTTVPRIETHLDATLASLRASREDVVITLLEDVIWQFRRQDWSRQDLVNMLRSAPAYMGHEYAFPQQET
jgi:hypothetical protein